MTNYSVLNASHVTAAFSNLCVKTYEIWREGQKIWQSVMKYCWYYNLSKQKMILIKDFCFWQAYGQKLFDGKVL